MLGVNIDHVATLRQARGTDYPSVVAAAKLAAQAGADGITAHLREDRRHIQEADVFALKAQLDLPLNFEMAVTDEMLDIAARLLPEKVCMVPERREELTTEGGLNVLDYFDAIKSAVDRCHQLSIEPSLFVDPDLKQIQAAYEAGAPVIELHTGAYAHASEENYSNEVACKEIERLKSAVEYACSLGLKVNAGHGLTLQNIAPIAAIPGIEEYNIGHSLIAKSIFVGLAQAVKDMKAEILKGPGTK